MQLYLCYNMGCNDGADLLCDKNGQTYCATMTGADRTGQTDKTGLGAFDFFGKWGIRWTGGGLVFA